MNESEIIKSINQNGIAKVENFLDNENLNIAEKILSKQKSIKNSEDAFLYRSKGNFFLKKLLYFKFFKFINCLKMTNLSKKLKLQELYRKGSTFNCMIVRHADMTKLLNYPDDPEDRGIASAYNFWIKSKIC